MLIDCLEAELKKPLFELLENRLCVSPSSSGLQIWELMEEDTGSSNKKFTVVGDAKYDLVIIRPNSLMMNYFNNSIHYLTSIPDFLIFINRKNDYLNTDVVVIDMKSTGADNKQLRSQFRNGKNIAMYLAKVTNREVRYCKFLKSSIIASKNKRATNPQKGVFSFESGFFSTKSKQLNILEIVRHHKGR